MYRYLFVLLISALLLPSVSFAQTPIESEQTPTCTIIYGGGEIECDATASATTKPTAAPTTQANKQPTTPSAGQGSSNEGSGQGTTKGGLPAGRQGVSVQKPTNPKETPATGPETLGLLALLPAAAAGFYLRKKS